jgi:Na+-driven multidrug efflux pump
MSARPANPTILRMSAPLILSFWMRSLLTFVDLGFASTQGDAAIAAVGGLSFPYEILMVACWVGVSTGMTSNLSQAMGRREGARIEQVIRTSRRIVWALVPLFSALALFIYFGAGLMVPDPVLARKFAIYGGVLIGGQAFTAFWSILPDSIVKAHHDTRSTMWAGIWSNVINVGLNTIFLFVFHWGVFGIAFSTVLGRFGGLVYALRRAASLEAGRKASEMDRAPALDPRPYRSILALAVPSGLTYGLMAVETSLVNWLLASRPGPTESIAAFGIYSRVLQFLAMPIIAASVAVLPYVARRFGEGNLAAVRTGMRQVSLAAAAYSVVVVTPAVALWGPPVARRLAESALTARLTTVALAFCPLACLALIPFQLCRPAFEGLQRGRPGLVMAVVRYVGLTVPCSLAGMALAERGGQPTLYGLLAGLLCASGLASGIFLVWLRRHLAAIEEVAVRAGPTTGSTTTDLAPTGG